MTAASVLFPKATAAQFRKIVADYAGLLPGWTRTKQNWIVRDAFPIRQSIWFERLRSGVYRPANAVSAIPFNLPSGIHEFLGAPNTVSKYTEHGRKWHSIADAMRHEFTPPPLVPLDLPSVIALAESALSGIAHRLFLGICRAWLGQVVQAGADCDYVGEYTYWLDQPDPDWLIELRQSASRLAESLDSRTEREFLAAAVRSH